ncbi:hypothetical protein KKG31_00470 [Patescibacteria group bacterium]|nr:hypothetical protein [Patescibacteria group bacterium]
MIDKMQADRERGEYFNPTHSPYPINDSPAMEYFPVNKVVDPSGKETIFNKKGK